MLPLRLPPSILIRNLWPIAVRSQRQHSIAASSGSDGGHHHSVDADDVKRHAKLAQDWWNPNGPMRALHSLNSIRVPFIRDGLLGTIAVDQELRQTSRPLQNLRLLEVGCGAGLLTESLARLHANVTAIDPGREVIDAARAHLANSSASVALSTRIDYRCETIENHATAAAELAYDACIVSEVLEHVVDKPAFLRACVSTIKPGGSIFITTFNRTCASWLGGIVVAEYLTRLVPRGTHDWDRFCTPIEAQRWLAELHCSTVLLNGFVYDMLTDRWRWIPTLDLSYALHAVKGN